MKLQRDPSKLAPFALLPVLAIGVGSARAVEFPVSAYAASLDTPPELVDPLSLLFRLPQRAACTETQLFVFSTSGDEALGVVGNWRGQGFFVLAQPHQTFYPPGSTFQAGWGGNLSAMRLGAAGRVTRSRDETFQMTTYQSELQANLEGAERTLWEGSAGLGAGQGRIEIDVAVDASRLDAKESYGILEAYQPYADTTLVYLESGDDWSYGGSAALRARFGSDVELSAAGFWNRLETSYTGFHYIQSEFAWTALERSYDQWSAGLSVSFPAGRLDWLAVSGRWSSIEGEEWDRSAADYRSDSSEQGLLAFAWRQNMWRDLWAHAGANVAYTREVAHYTEVGYQGRESRRDETSERFSQDFSCGASYSWRNFDVRAAVRETFPLSDLFIAVDVIVRP